MVDGALKLAGKKPFLCKIYNRMNKATGALEYFTNNEWRWDTANVDQLREKMSKEDQERFNFKVDTLDWSDFMRNYCLGTRKYILKDPLTTMGSARKKLLILRIADYILKIVLLLCFCKVVLMTFELLF